MPAVKPIPEGYHSVTPYLIFSGAGEAIAFYKRVLFRQQLCKIRWQWWVMFNRVRRA